MDAGTFRERKVSILINDDNPSFVLPHKQLAGGSQASGDAHTLPRIDRRASHNFSYFSTKTSPALSPRTPPLLRFDSTSSTSTMDSPSPVTPVYSYEPVQQGPTVTPYDTLIRHGSTTNTMFPALPSDEMSPYQPSYGKVRNNGLPSLNTANHTSAYPAMASPNRPETPQSAGHDPSKGVKKNKYPCPYAASHDCAATFTTSGHAARHGKKHTGEKGVLCPVCGKAFTRKDNMKQHERTHKSSSTDHDHHLAKEEPRRKKSKAEPLARRESVDSTRSAAVEVDMSAISNPMMDPHAYEPSIPSGIHYQNPMPLDNFAIDPSLRMDIRPHPQRTFSESEASSNGLDALAMAASNISYGPFRR